MAPTDSLQTQHAIVTNRLHARWRHAMARPPTLQRIATSIPRFCPWTIAASWLCTVVVLISMLRIRCVNSDVRLLRHALGPFSTLICGVLQRGRCHVVKFSKVGVQGKDAALHVLNGVQVAMPRIIGQAALGPST